MLPSVLPRLATELAVRVFPGVWKLLFLRLLSRDGAPSLPLLCPFFVVYIFSYLLLKTMGCFSGCLMSSAVIQKLFCGIYSGLNVLLMNLWGRKWSPCPIPQPSYHKQASVRYQERLSGQRVFREVRTKLEECSKQSMRSLQLRLGIMHLNKCK